MENEIFPSAIKGAQQGLRTAKLKIGDAMIYVGNLSSSSEVIGTLELHDDIIVVIDLLGKAIKKVAEIQEKVGQKIADSF